MLSLSTEIVKEVTRRESLATGLKVTRYYLCADRSPSGGQFLYIKCHEENWTNTTNSEGKPQLLRENFAVSGDFGDNYYLALHIFKKIAEAKNIVSLSHLGDICRDEILGHGRRARSKNVAENSPRLFDLRPLLEKR